MSSPAITAHAPVRTMGRALRVVLATAAILVLSTAALLLERASVPASAAAAQAPAASTRADVPAVPGLTRRQVSLVITGLRTGTGSSVSQAVYALSPG